MKRWRRILLGAGVALALAWVAFAGLLFRAMHLPPDSFGQFMTHVPMPAMMLVPFESMWNSARGGHLSVGDLAPDFELQVVDVDAAGAEGAGTLRLSSYRGSRPVVLVFGSYT